MKNYFAIILLLSLLTFASAVGAQSPLTQLIQGSGGLLPDVCTQIFGPVGSGGLADALPGLNDYTSYNFMLELSLTVVLAVLMLLGILYGIGQAFTISRINSFVKTEYLESILNIIIVLVLFGGMLVIAGGVNFITSLGSAIVGASGVASQTGSGYGLVSTTASVQTVQDLYESICGVYWGDAALHFAGLVFLSGITFIYSLISSITVSYMPNGVGVAFGFGAGLTPFNQVLSFMTPLISGAIIVEVGIIFLLAIIYYLFPLFLFAGVLLRALPWTRAAGGTLLALFIGFYVFFPALLYPFASVDYRCLAAQQTTAGLQYQTACMTTQQGYLNLPSFQSTPAGLVSGVSSFFSGAASFFNEGQFIALMDFWIFSIINASFQIFGVVISFVISYSLLEGFADLLGAPSLQAKDILRNVI